MRNEKQNYLRWLYRKIPLEGFYNFQEFLPSALEEAFCISLEEAASIATASENKFWNLLVKDWEEAQRKGIAPVFDILDSNNRRIEFHSVSIRGDVAENRLLHRLKSRPNILRKIDLLNPTEYEALGCVVSELIGAKNTSLTRKSGDGGVDFYALIEFPTRCHLFAANRGPIRVIGQSKKYINPVPNEKIDVFITTINEIKARNPRRYKHVPNWFRSASGPIIGWIIGHQGFKREAIEQSRHYGIVISDSIDVAEIACRSRKIDESLSPENRALNFQQMVRSYI